MPVASWVPEHAARLRNDDLILIRHPGGAAAAAGSGIHVVTGTAAQSTMNSVAPFSVTERCGESPLSETW